jgi:NAD(P)-dependent dehydrogenase (short-subunit alcohol dehydrogenase family)
MDPMLHGKTIVIIGGTTGLGLSAAKACAVAGANVVAVGADNDQGDAAKFLGPSAMIVAGDSADPKAAPWAIATAVREFGGFDGLYHAAGSSGRIAGDGPLHELTDEGWSDTLQLNLTGLFYSNRAAAKQFLEQGSGGSVVNLGSVLGSSPSPRYFPVHALAAAKAAVVGLSVSSAAYYASHNIRFNVIAPGLVDTRVSGRPGDDATTLRFLKSKQPLDGGRIGRPDDLDAAVVYFLSDVSKFVTGQVLSIAGGWGVSEGQYPTGA